MHQYPEQKQQLTQVDEEPTQPQLTHPIFPKDNKHPFSVRPNQNNQNPMLIKDSNSSSMVNVLSKETDFGQSQSNYYKTLLAEKDKEIQHLWSLLESQRRDERVARQILEQPTITHSARRMRQH